MKVFIDTNVLLDIFNLSGPDLEELRKLKRMVEKGKVELLVSHQVVDEFWRNRERVISEALKTFRESKAAARIPNIIRTYPKSKELKDLVDRTNELIKELALNATEDIERDSLKADLVLKELFDVFQVGAVDEGVFQKAKRRQELGNPPGKKDSLGDAVNWEWLLSQEMEFWDTELVLISMDNDFESELIKGKPREYLVREWQQRNPTCELTLEKSLPAFFAKYFPDILLAEEIDKIEAIEHLEKARNFAAVHRAVAALGSHNKFKENEIQRLISAFCSNSQINWIIGDDDVKELGWRIVSEAKSPAARAAAEPLKVQLLSVSDDFDIPF